MSNITGEILTTLCKHAKKEVFLAAPFIKTNSLKRILVSIPVEIDTITIVTRWIPSEIASGVSDLEVFDLLKSRPNTKLLLHPCLHAKYYRVDNRCLIGSANITAKALGWCATPNIELLVEANPDDSLIKELEIKLKSQGVIATELVRDAIQKEVDALREKMAEVSIEVNQEDQNISRMWLPVCNKPEYLFKIYSRQDTSSLLNSIVNAGKHDLDVLNLLPGMTEVDFKKYVAAIFEQTPAAQEIYTRLKDSGITSEAAETVIAKYREEISDPPYDTDTYWQIFKIWLIYFFPDLYRVRASAEVLELAKEI